MCNGPERAEHKVLMAFGGYLHGINKIYTNSSESSDFSKEWEKNTHSFILLLCRSCTVVTKQLHMTDLKSLLLNHSGLFFLLWLLSMWSVCLPSCNKIKIYILFFRICSVAYSLFFVFSWKEKAFYFIALFFFLLAYVHIQFSTDSKSKRIYFAYK